MERTGKRVVWIAIIALIIGGLLGYWIGKSQAHPNKQHTEAILEAETTTKDDETLPMALGEHASLTVAALNAQAKGTPDASAAATALDNNSDTIANLVDARFSGTKGEFLRLWNQHIGYYKAYLSASKSGDNATKQQAKQDLMNFSDEVSTFFNNHDKRINKAELQQAFTAHGDQVTAIIDALVANDSAKVYNTAHEAYVHMGQIANIIGQ